MTPDPNSTANSASPRVQLAPHSGPLDVDGGWWPRSTDLTEELPVLLAAVADRVGHITVVGYPLGAWAPAPEQLDTAAGAVQLQGFVSDDSQTLVVIGEHGSALSLLVIPPETPADRAGHRLEELGSTPADDPAVESIADQNTDRSLDDVAERLARHAGQDPEHSAEIAGWVHDAAVQFTAAPVTAFVPILVEHIVRGRIAAARRSG